MPYEQKNIPLARQLRREMTPWERKLWYCFLTTYPIRFQRQKPFGKYIVDFYCARAKLVIELDGSGHYEADAQQRDRIRTAQLEQMGLTVIRFSNRDVDRNFYGVCSVIHDTVRARVK